MTTKIVVWVDEDERIWAPERNLLKGMGFDVLPVSDATSALSVIPGLQLEHIELIILDVMLLQGEDTVTFSDAATAGGIKTGLVLGKKLVHEKIIDGRRLLFFSRVVDGVERAEIGKVARELNAIYLQKSPQTQGKHFIKWLREHLVIK